MAFWRDDDFVQPGGPRFGRFADGGVVRGVGHPPGRDFRKAREETRDKGFYVLQGLHNQSGNWVTLLRFEDEDDAVQALKDCNGSVQPDLTQAVIKWDHFSAYKIDTHVTITWMRYP